MRFDNGYTPNAFESQIEVFAKPLAIHLSASELNGNIFGFAAGAGFYKSDYIAQAHFAYARGESEQNLATQDTKVKADLLQIAGFSRLFRDKIEVDLGANIMFGLFDLKNSWFINDEMNFNAKFNTYQGNLSTVLGYRFGGDFSVKPFLGVQALFEKQEGFRQNNGLNLQSNAYSELIIGGIIGLETRYIFENGAFIVAKASYENFNEEQNERFAVGVLNTDDNKLRYESYDNVLNFSIGGRVYGGERLKIDLQGLYQHYNDGLNAFGGNVAVRWEF